MSEHEERKELLQRERLSAFNKIGQVSDQLLVRPRPITIGDKIYSWPANAIGKLRIIRLEKTIMVVTDGLSDPWDPVLHGETASKGTFGFEAAIETPAMTLPDSTDQGIAESWLPAFLWAATDWVVAEKFDLKGALIKFKCLTTAIPPARGWGFDDNITPNGYIGGLLGIPFGVDQLGAQVVIADDGIEPVWLLPIKILTADEYQHATSNPDAETIRMASAFLERGDRQFSWPMRESIVPHLKERAASH